MAGKFSMPPILGIEHKTRMCYNQGQLGWQVGGITRLISPVGGGFGYAFVIYTAGISEPLCK